jgi:HK97 family phage portal protein
MTVTAVRKWLGGLLQVRGAGPPATSTLWNPQPWLREALGLAPTDSGMPVSGYSSLQCTAVFGCVRVLSEGVASLPLYLYRRRGETTEKAVRHPLFKILHQRPNALQTAYEWRALLMTWLCLFGNAYCKILKDREGNVTELWPLRPDLMILRMDWKTGTLSYDYMWPGAEMVHLDPDEVLHLRGLSTDGLVGLSPISAARQSIGLTLTAEKFGAMYFGSGSRIGGIIEVPESLNDESIRNMRESWARSYAGIDNAHSIAILENGMKFHATEIKNDEAQWIETRRFGVEDIARIFRVPKHMLADLSQGNYSNVETLDRSFVTQSLTPWLTNLEQAFALKLLKPEEQDDFYCEHDINRSMRGDPTARMKAYQLGIYSGIYSPNDCRRLENMNEREGGSVYLQPVNMAPSPWNPATAGSDEVAPKENQV